VAPCPDRALPAGLASVAAGLRALAAGPAIFPDPGPACGVQGGEPGGELVSELGNVQEGELGGEAEDAWVNYAGACEVFTRLHPGGTPCGPQEFAARTRAAWNALFAERWPDLRADAAAVCRWRGDARAAAEALAGALAPAAVAVGVLEIEAGAPWGAAGSARVLAGALLEAGGAGAKLAAACGAAGARCAPVRASGPGARPDGLPVPGVALRRAPGWRGQKWPARWHGLPVALEDS